MSTKNIPNYRAPLAMDDSGAYDLTLDDQRLGEILFYPDAYRIVNVLRAIHDPTRVLAALGAEGMASTDIDVVRRVLAAVVKLGEAPISQEAYHG